MSYTSITEAYAPYSLPCPWHPHFLPHSCRPPRLPGLWTWIQLPLAPWLLLPPLPSSLLLQPAQAARISAASAVAYCLPRQQHMQTHTHNQQKPESRMQQRTQKCTHRHGFLLLHGKEMIQETRHAENLETYILRCLLGLLGSLRNDRRRASMRVQR